MDRLTIELSLQEREFYQGYIDAIEFAECGDDGQPEYGAEFTPEAERQIVIECLSFMAANGCYLAAIERDTNNLEIYKSAGADFWFTRVGHGVGFWDKPEVYGDTYSDLLTKFSDAAGERWVTPNDDGMIEYG